MSDTTPAADTPTADRGDPPICPYCSLPSTTDATAAAVDAPYCSTTCQDAHTGDDDGLLAYEDAACFQAGVSAIDAALPQGIPRDSLTVLSGEAGTRVETVLLELAWRTLGRGEPVVLVAVSLPPLSLVRQFLALEWNVIPHLESGLLRLIDGYSYRTGTASDQDAWDAHLQQAATVGRSLHVVHDPTQSAQLHRHLSAAVRDLSMAGRGTIIIDSMTEIGTMIRPMQAYELLKDLRAEFCKAQRVAMFVGAHYSGNPDEYPHEMEYLFDGIIDLSLNPNLVQNLLVKELTVRKMQGVFALAERRSFEYVKSDGMIVIQAVDAAASSDDDGADDDEAVDDDGDETAAA